MREDRPAWYERAGKGPFAREAFDEGMRETIERRVAGKRDRMMQGRAKRGRAALAFAGAAALLAILLLARYQIDWPGPSAVNGPSVGSPAPSSPPASSSATVVRAEGLAKSGRLQVVPVGAEKQEPLGAPSCIGTETDIRFEGDYRVVYAGADGSERVIAELPALTFVQPTSEKVRMMKLTFPEAEVFLLAPQYADCRAIAFYAYAVDDSGQAFPLSFRSGDGTIAELSYYPPGRLPAVRGGQLVLPSSEGPGGETAGGPQDRAFTLDLSAKALIQSSPNGTEKDKGKDAPGADTGLTRTFDLGGRTYKIGYPGSYASKFVFADETASGIVWVPAPVMTDTTNELDIRPAEPFSLYLSDKSGGELKAASAEKLYTLPLMDGQSYVYLSGLYGAGKYLVYTTYSKQPGMNQPVREQLWTLDTDSPAEARPLLDYHASGGSLFTMGIQADEGDVVTIARTPNGDGDYDVVASLFRLQDGTQERLSSFKQDEKGIRYVKAGKTLTAAVVVP